MLKAELAARGVSVLGLSERSELVEALLGAPPATVPAGEAAPAAAAAAAAATPAAAVAGQWLINIVEEAVAIEQWSDVPLAATVAAAERGNASAQFSVGLRYYEGDSGVPQDFTLAARWLRKAADLPFSSAQAVLGTAYADGKGVPQSDAEALKWFRLGAARGAPQGQTSLGNFHESRGGLVADVDEAVRLYVLSAATDFDSAVDELRRLSFSLSGALVCRACFALPPAGTELQRCTGFKVAYYCGAACRRADWGPRHKDECKAHKARQAAQRAVMEAQQAAQFRWFNHSLADICKAADKGDSAAQAALGEFYCRCTKGLVQSRPLLAEWRAKAALGGDPHAPDGNAGAQQGLGCHYLLGLGVVQNKAEALRLFKLSAKQGLREARPMLGTCLAECDVCEPAHVQAALWMRRAADLGDAVAQIALARWYTQGIKSLPIDYKEAMRFARLAAAQGHLNAACLIGVLFDKGHGVAENRDEACKWYRQAAEQGEAASKNNLLVLARFGHAPSIASVRDLGLDCR